MRTVNELVGIKGLTLKAGCRACRALLWVFLTAIPVTAAQAQAPSPPFTFESFLENPPTITEAVILRELAALPGIPDNAREETFLIRRDRRDFLTSVLNNNTYEPIGLDNGRLAGIYWDRLGSNVTILDPAINRTNTTAAKFNEALVAVLSNLGFQSIDRSKPVVWRKEKSAFDVELVDTPGGKGTIVLEYENGLPSKGTLENPTTGESFACVKYQYDPAFHDGRFPVQFSLFAHDQSYMVITFRRLETTSGPLALADIDPSKLYAGPNFQKYIQSNNIPYVVQGGVMKRVFTAAELTVGRRNRAEALHPGSFKFARAAMWSLIVIPPLFWLLRRYRIGRRKQQ